MCIIFEAAPRQEIFEAAPRQETPFIAGRRSRTICPPCVASCQEKAKGGVCCKCSPGQSVRRRAEGRRGKSEFQSTVLRSSRHWPRSKWRRRYRHGCGRQAWKSPVSEGIGVTELESFYRNLSVCVFYCQSNLVWTNLVGHAT